MTTRSDNEEDYFSDPVKLVHTAEDKTFITDERFIDAEIIDLGDILSAEEDAEYDSPQRTDASMHTPVKTPNSCRNTLLNPSVSLVDCCKIRSKNKRQGYSNTKTLESKPMKVKHQKRKNEDSKTDSEIEIIDGIDSNKSKTHKNNLTCLTPKTEIEKAIEQRNMVKIDIKKNTGLIGLKIKRANVDFEKKTSCKENTSNEQKTNPTQTIEKVSKRNIYEVKTKTELKKKDESFSLLSNPKAYTTERIKEATDQFHTKHPKKDFAETLDKFDKEKPTDGDVSKLLIPKSTLSPKKTCRDVNKSLVKNICENDTNSKERVPVLTTHSEDKEHVQINFKQKSISESYINLKENGFNCDNKVMPQQNPKENTRHTTPKTYNIVEQRSFPKLNKFTKNVLKKASKIQPKINPVKTSQYEKYIRPNMKTYMKENNTSTNEEASQNCKHLELGNTKKSDINDSRQNLKTDPVPKSLQYQMRNTNLISEVSLRDSQSLTSNKRKIQSTYCTPSSLAQVIDMNGKEASVVKLPLPFPSISSNVSSISPQTNAQLQHNVLNIDNTKETSCNAFQATNQHFSIPSLVSDRNNIENPRHDIVFQYNKPSPQTQMQPDMTKPPPRLNGTNVHQSFPDAKMMKKTPTPPHNMNLYRPSPPNAFTPYQYFYPMTMASVPDNSGIYTVNNQNFCRVGPYMLPYGTEIYPHPPPQQPPPPPPPPPPPSLPTFPPASQQRLQQTFPNISQLSTQDSIIGRNNGRDIKKINISAPPSTKQDISNNDIDSKKGTKKDFISNNIQQNSKNVKEEIAILQMPPEFDSDKQPNNIVVFTHSPNSNSKRTSQFSIRDEKINNKPCPLSKKVKMSDSRTLPKQGQINKDPVKKGYSPPILPIPTFENILSHTRVCGMGLITNTIAENPVDKNIVFPPRHDHHTELRKITLDDYKKKNSMPSDKTRAIKYQGLDKLVKNLCQK